MIEVVGVVVAALVPMGGWVLAIQSKVATHEILIDAQKELLLSKLDNISDRLGRIEKSLNGHLLP